MKPNERLSPKDIVLGAVRRPGRQGVIFGGVVAAVLHVGAGAMAFTMVNGERKAPPAKPMVVVHHVVDLHPPPKEEEPPQPPPPPPEEVKAPPKLKVKQPKAPPQPVKAPPPEAPDSEPPPAAQAGQVVAAEAPGPATFDIATGKGDSFAGGTTSSSGTGKEANHTGQAGTGTGTGHNYTRPPTLRSRDWPCGWPPEAEDTDLEEAYVTVRATVNADGSVPDVQVVADPGHGFGRRAVWCAKSKVKFDPALDATGKPISALTPPMRIHFIRED